LNNYCISAVRYLVWSVLLFLVSLLIVLVCCLFLYLPSFTFQRGPCHWPYDCCVSTLVIKKLMITIIVIFIILIIKLAIMLMRLFVN